MHWKIVYPSHRSARMPWMTDHIPAARHAFDLIPADYAHDRSRPRTNARQWLDYLRHAWRGWRAASRDARQPMGLITAFPQLPVFLGMFNRLTGARRPILCWSFNLGTQFGGWRVRLARFGLRGVDVLVVHSRREIESYSALLGLERARFVFLAERMGPLWTLNAAELRALLTYCLAERHDLERARALVEAAMDRARPTHLSSARRFLILGAFWFWAGAPAALARLRAAGIRIGVLVYDLIPVSHPEYTSQGTVLAYRQGLAEGARLWDFALTISAWTAKELAEALRGLAAPAIPIRPVPLAHRLHLAAPPGPQDWPATLADLRGKEFVLCVGTLEARKNHLALFQAWRLLLREGFEPPPLVLVGKAGWRVADLMAQLKATNFLDQRIRLVQGASDPELEALYQACLFTVFPSFTEGWGLPVGEALSHGKVVLATSEGATPEPGEGFTLPIDAFNPRGIAAEVRRLVTDRAALAAAEARARFVAATPRDAPDIGVFARQEAGQFQQDSTSLGLRVRVPLATEARNAPRRAEAQGEVTRAAAELAQARRLVESGAARAELALRDAERALVIARQRLAVAREQEGLALRAFQAGETGTFDLFRIRQLRLDAANEEGRAAVEALRARSRLNQARGHAP